MLPRKPATRIETSEWWPSETVKPAKSITASLGIGMQAEPAPISRKTPHSPVSLITLTQNSTIGPVRLAWGRSMRRHTTAPNLRNGT